MPFSQQEYALYYDETCLINKTGRPQYDLDYARSNGTSVTTANPYSYLSSSMSGGDYSLVTVLNDEETFYDFYHATFYSYKHYCLHFIHDSPQLFQLSKL